MRHQTPGSLVWRASRDSLISTMTETLPLANKTEVTARAQRRRFTAAEKLRVLREADRCTKSKEDSV